MKKLLLAIALILVAFTGRAQISFLGIPLDSATGDMVEQLKRKGFKLRQNGNGEMLLLGRFNGKPAEVTLDSFEGKVFGVTVGYARCQSEKEINGEYDAMLDRFRSDSSYREFEGAFFTNPAIGPGTARGYGYLTELSENVESMSVEERKLAISAVSSLPGFVLINEICTDITSVDRPSAEAIAVFREDLAALFINKVDGKAWFGIEEDGDGYRAGYSGSVQGSKAMYYAANVASYDDADKKVDSYHLRADSYAIGLSTASTCNGHNIRPVTDPQFTAWWTNGAPPSATTD